MPSSAAFGSSLATKQRAKGPSAKRAPCNDAIIATATRAADQWLAKRQIYEPALCQRTAACMKFGRIEIA